MSHRQEHAAGGEFAKVGGQKKIHPAGGVRQGNASHDKDDQQQKQQGKKKLADQLDAVAHPEADRQAAKKHKADLGRHGDRWGIGDLPEGRRGLFGGREVQSLKEPLKEVGNRPPPDRAVVGQDDKRREDAQVADRPPAVEEEADRRREKDQPQPDAGEDQHQDPGQEEDHRQHSGTYRRTGSDLGEGADRVALRVSAQRDLTDHDRQPDEENTDQIDEDESPAAVLAGNIGKAPNIPKPHRGAGRGEDKSETPPPLFTGALFTSHFTVAAHRGSCVDMYLAEQTSCAKPLLYGMRAGAPIGRPARRKPGQKKKEPPLTASRLCGGRR